MPRYASSSTTLTVEPGAETLADPDRRFTTGVNGRVRLKLYKGSVMSSAQVDKDSSSTRHRHFRGRPALTIKPRTGFIKLHALTCASRRSGGEALTIPPFVGSGPCAYRSTPRAPRARGLSRRPMRAPLVCSRGHSTKGAGIEWAKRTFAPRDLLPAPRVLRGRVRLGAASHAAAARQYAVELLDCSETVFGRRALSGCTLWTTLARAAAERPR